VAILAKKENQSYVDVEWKKERRGRGKKKIGFVKSRER